LQWALSVRATVELHAEIEKNQHNTASEITLAIPMALPYGEMNANQQFERMSGAFEYKGEQYQFVKQKLERDTLFVVCIKNTAKEKIDQTIEGYVKTSNDHPTQSKQTLNLLSKLFKDYQRTVSISFISCNNNNNSESSISMLNTFVVLDPVYPIPSPPPKGVS